MITNSQLFICHYHEKTSDCSSHWHVTCGGGIVTSANAQKYRPKYLREDDKAFRALTSYTSENGWIEFRRDITGVEATSFFDKFGKNLGLSDGYKMQLTQDETDPKENRHRRYQLLWRNIPVEGSEFTLHSRKDQLTTAQGRVVEALTIDVSKPIIETQALAKALTDQKLTVNDFKGDAKLPKGTLLLTSMDGDFVNSSYRLAYTFDVYGKGEPLKIYVDAM